MSAKFHLSMANNDCTIVIDRVCFYCAIFVISYSAIELFLLQVCLVWYTRV